MNESESSVDNEENSSLSTPSTDYGKATKSIATSTFGTLFKPSAELIGQELKTWTENKISERKKKRVKENTDKAKVINPEINDAEIKSQKQIDNFEKWIEGVSEIEVEDPIAIAWQKILLDITQDNFDTDILLDTLNSLDRGEASFFASYIQSGIYEMHPDKRDHYLKKLTVKNIFIEEEGYTNIILRFYVVFSLPLYGRKSRVKNRYRLTWVGEALAEYLR